MRTIAGAVLVLAAAVCLAAGVVADALLRAENVLGNPSGIAYLGAALLAPFGLLLIAVGDGPRRRGPDGEG